MRLQQSIRRKRRRRSGGVEVNSDLNLELALNANQRGATTSSTARQRIVQKNGGARVTEKEQEQPKDELSAEELDAQSGEELPDREAMSLINANVAAPINAAVALNALSDNSTAYANAEQTNQIVQEAG